MGFFFVALGGALGAAGRYALSLILVRTKFPSITLMTNILSAIAIGFIAGLLGTRDDLSPNVALFWKTGVCGGFTTFSTFALETADLMKAGHTGAAFLYVLLSVLAGVAVIFAVEAFSAP